MADNRNFRTEWIGIPLVVIGMAYFFTHIKPVLEWSRILSNLNINNKERYSMMVILGLILIAVTLICKLFRKR
jgi:hypothetical protein